MNNDEILTNINLRKYDCIIRTGIEPNHVVLGIETFKTVGRSNQMVLNVFTNNVNAEIFGLPITIDYERPNTIMVGYMSKCEGD